MTLKNSNGGWKLACEELIDSASLVDRPSVYNCLHSSIQLNLQPGGELSLKWHEFDLPLTFLMSRKSESSAGRKVNRHTISVPTLWNLYVNFGASQVYLFVSAILVWTLTWAPISFFPIVARRLMKISCLMSSVSHDSGGHQLKTYRSIVVFV
jgi:hypothetical protein